MPSRKWIGDDEGKTNENKKKKRENTTKSKRIWPEDKMDESIKSLLKKCPDCKSGNHRFWMFANHNLKQPRYKCLNNDCPREAYTIGSKVRQKKAQGINVKNVISTNKAQEKPTKIIQKFRKKTSFVFNIDETNGNNQNTTEGYEVTDVEGVFDNNDFGKTSNSSDSNKISNSSDSNEISSSSDYDETLNNRDSNESLDANENMHGENMDYENNFDNDEEYEHLVPKMTKAEIKIADEAEKDYSYFEEYTNKDGEKINLLTFVEYRTHAIL